MRLRDISPLSAFVGRFIVQSYKNIYGKLHFEFEFGGAICIADSITSTIAPKHLII